MNEKQLFDPARPVARPEAGLSRYTARAFLWMALGLLVTFGVSVGGYLVELPYRLFMLHPYTIFVITGLELVLVIVLSAKLHALPIPAAVTLFLGYAVLNGIVFSTYFYLYDLTGVILVFGVTAVYFTAMALFGFFTSADLSRLRNILLGGLIFLVVFGLVSIFIPNLGMLERIVCLAGVAVFMGFTAYDTQKIKALYYGFQGDDAMLARASIFSALQLYLDFINLFLYLLRFLGKRKN